MEYQYPNPNSKTSSWVFILIVAFFLQGQAYAATVTVSFAGTINLAPLGGDSNTLLNGSFNINPDGESGLSNLKIYTADDFISADQGKALFKEDIKISFLEEALFFSLAEKNLAGSIRGNEIQAVWGAFGFSTSAISDHLMQAGEISPSVLQFSQLVFGYREHPGFFGYRPLFASIDSISIVPSPVPLSASLIFMISGIILIAGLLWKHNKILPDGHQARPAFV